MTTSLGKSTATLWHDSACEAADHTWSLDERVVVAPCEGRFRIAPSSHYTAEGEYAVQGQIMGHIKGTNGDMVPVQSPFAGWVMGFLVRDGVHVQSGEPVMWLRQL